VSKDIFKKKLAVVDKQLAAKLEEIQISLSHNGDRGSSAEYEIREFLRSYLPSSNRIGEGEVVDANGNTTTQLDIIIANEYQPYINDSKGPGLYIIEGVDCVGEVKTNLNSNDIETLMNSCMRYKKLTTNFIGGLANFNKSDEKRFLTRKPYFVFVYKSQLKIETIHSKMVDFYSENNIPIEEQIDGFFCLDRGTIINFGDGKGSFHFRMKDNKSVPGIIITKNVGDGILGDLMTWLSATSHKVIYFSSPLTKYLLK